MNNLQKGLLLFNRGTEVPEFLVLLALRLYLASVFWVAGSNKLAGFDSVVEWFGNPDWGLGLPFPALMAALATAAELGGALLLLSGFAVRLATVPLIITMLVAMLAVHWPYGWQAVADLHSPGVTGATHEALERLGRAREILQQYGNYDWLTDNGRFSFVVSNNGVEWAATYLLMLGVLLVRGGGRWLSVDYWLMRRFVPSAEQ